MAHHLADDLIDDCPQTAPLTLEPDADAQLLPQLSILGFCRFQQCLGLVQDIGLHRNQPVARALLCQSHLHSGRSEEHTSELQSLMRISYAVFCLKKKKRTNIISRNSLTSKEVSRPK